MVTQGRLLAVDQLAYAPPPERLWHYTSPHGLIGICESRSLWATSIAFLNDRSEGQAAAALAAVLLENQLDPRFPHRARITDDEAKLFSAMRLACDSSSRGMYVFSLSEERDQLSQWRGYCPESGGYSLGIGGEYLRAAAADAGMLLLPCVYEHVAQCNIMDNLIMAALMEFRQQRRSDAIEHCIEFSAAQFERDLRRFGPIIKHRAFREEREWRIISDVIGGESERLKFRAGRSSVVPYVAVPLPDEARGVPLNPGAPGPTVTVVLGPVRGRVENFGVSALMNRCFPPAVAIGHSEAPFETG